MTKHPPSEQEPGMGAAPLAAAYPEKLAMPEVIFNEYARRCTVTGKYASLLDGDKPPMSLYHQAVGYEFPWGQILERRVDNKVLWDFILTTLLAQYHDDGLLLPCLQQDSMAALEQAIPALVEHDPSAASLNLKGHRACQGIVASAFAIYCHFSQAEAVLGWLNGDFVPDILPKVIYLCQQSLKRRTRHGHCR